MGDVAFGDEAANPRPARLDHLFADFQLLLAQAQKIGAAASFGDTATVCVAASGRASIFFSTAST
jgi:hypothetical protein